MTVAWPTTLPSYIERGTYTLTPSAEQIRTDFSAGPARMRRRASVAVPTFELTMVFVGREFEIFKAFYANDLQNGVGWFTLGMYAGGDVFADHELRFTEPYRMRDAGFERVVVQMKLEARQLLGLSTAVSVFLGVYEEDFLIDWADDIDRAVNVEYPKVNNFSLST